MIYFITARDVGRIKIGFSEAPSARLIKMRTDSPCDLIFERVMSGGRETEAVLHQLFASARLRGEWFELNEQIEAFMDGLEIPTATRKARDARAKAEAFNARDDADLIRARGGIRPVARLLGHTNHTTVQGWLERNRIPDQHRAAVLDLPVLGAAA